MRLLDKWAINFDMSGRFHLRPGLPTEMTQWSMMCGERYKSVVDGRYVAYDILPLFASCVKERHAIVLTEEPRIPVALLFLVRVPLFSDVPGQLPPAIP